MQIDSLKIVSEGGTEEMGVKPESEKCSGGFRDFLTQIAGGQLPPLKEGKL